eukprot:CAMPEP_0175159706 /NCGR_PEP_ID=MMETSP0087-20121206/23575_1 /TAXON_ID=136419 /ORGANISM="Unknown Unknown, Strain D1" /LENGTH=147 /DNA_ID=CAMNT_0016447793 /DNA_START=95 /DNA_END=536 /DNA_ORIENTATION=+
MASSNRVFASAVPYAAVRNVLETRAREVRTAVTCLQTASIAPTHSRVPPTVTREEAEAGNSRVFLYWGHDTSMSSQQSPYLAHEFSHQQPASAFPPQLFTQWKVVTSVELRSEPKYSGHFCMMSVQQSPFFLQDGSHQHPVFDWPPH